MAITVTDAMNAMGQDWECSEVLRAEVRRLRTDLAAAEQRASESETHEHLLQDLYDAEIAVQEAEAALVAWESDGGEYPGHALLGDAMERRETAIAAIVRTVTAWGEHDTALRD